MVQRRYFGDFFYCYDNIIFLIYYLNPINRLLTPQPGLVIYDPFIAHEKMQVHLISPVPIVRQSEILEMSGFLQGI